MKLRKRKNHGQGATEYLLLLSAALLIAIVALSLAGGFWPIDSRIAESSSYWKTATPFAIKESSQDGGNLTLVVENTDPRQRQIKEINVEGMGVDVEYAHSEFLSPGDRRAYRIATGLACVGGSIYEYTIRIAYDTLGQMGTLTQEGKKPLIGVCSSTQEQGGGSSPPCANEGEPCSENSVCCSEICSGGICAGSPSCTDNGAVCTAHSECCSAICHSIQNICIDCQPDGSDCSSDLECCAGSPFCSDGTCRTCKSDGLACSQDSECCGTYCNPDLKICTALPM